MDARQLARTLSSRDRCTCTTSDLEDETDDVRGDKAVSIDLRLEAGKGCGVDGDYAAEAEVDRSGEDGRAYIEADEVTVTQLY